MFVVIIIFIITLLILVLVHEFGHFIAAKKFNIKVLEFGFGIPPRAWGKKVGETIVSINWLPFGGFVRLLGEDEVDQRALEDQRSFAAQGVSKRILVVIAGVAMNFLLACFLFYIVLSSQGFKAQLALGIGGVSGDVRFFGVNESVETVVLVADISDNSPAQVADIKKGDRVLAINDELIGDRDQLSAKLKSLAGQEVSLILSDLEKKETRTVKLTPRQNPPEGQGPLGVALGGFKVVNLLYETPVQKILAGPLHAVNLVVFSGRMLGELIGRSIEQSSFEPVSGAVAGPVGITTVANTILTASSEPLLPYLDFVALLSLNLAVLNLLPFPALDGGRLFFLIIEAITRRKVHASFEKWVHTIGMAILLTLALVVTASDISKIFF